ncbi:hypothetical protein [Niallia sp. RD1]|uniref:hypothetical protein n=1 Tax=Niallia sp. RD1 TaxID=2962858 RepID=UPI0020C1B1ED|nr:hypothetical protein [Niallia sp. RD1]UTI44420.1 hypothetical protein NKG37_12820 [Niallia sp. RD1]
MKVFVVLHQENKKSPVTVLDTYTDEEKASKRVKWERDLTDEIVWYQESELIGK